MWFVERPGGPPRYRDWTDKSVRYFTVVDKDGGGVLGYVWAGDEDEAAAYQPRQAAGSRGVNEGMSWIIRLREAKARGIRPSQALAEFLADPEPGGRGRPLPGSLADAPNTAAVEDLANGGSERPVNRRFDDDMFFRQVSPGPPRYQTRSDKPVRYFSVVDKDGGGVLGYVWAGDEDDAAAWVPRKAAGGRALAEGGHWYARLEEAKGRGIPPSQALAEMLSNPEGNRGRALPDSLTDAPNAGVVKALAQDA